MRGRRAGAILLGMAALAGCGGGTSPSATPTPPTAVAGAGSSTTVVTGLGTLGRGSCVTWNQTATAGPSRTGTVVSCDEPHLAEIVGQPTINGLGRTWPGPAALASYGASHCADQAASFLGKPVDPAGRFGVEAIYPTEGAWTSGSRALTCGLVARQSGGATTLAPFTGRVTVADEALLLPVGTCLAGTTGAAARTVPCTASHSVEVTGTAAVPPGAPEPMVATQYQLLVGTRCTQLGAAYVGGAFPPEVASGWFPVSPASWAAGRRSVQCLVGRQDDAGGWIPVTGTLRHGER